MLGTPNSMRLQLAVVGRTNAGKSTLVNLVAGQEVAITSPVAGTTTDVVEKPMELRPLGPILLLDTAGLDDATELGSSRLSRTRRAVDRADVLVLVVRNGVWGEPEQRAVELAAERRVKVVPVLNLEPGEEPQPGFPERIQEASGMAPLSCVATAPETRDPFLESFKTALFAAAPEDFFSPPPLLADLVSPADLVVLLVPLDMQAPKGRLILPQVQVVRDALDLSAIPLLVREEEYAFALEQLKRLPALVVCDSQVIDLMVRHTPRGVPCTTFSILFARLKGDLEAFAAGAAAIHRLRPGDRVLIAEGCTHHAAETDIGRVKIPRWLEQKVGGPLQVTVAAGRDYPEDLASYRLVIHCGGCMLNRREMLRRIALAQAAGVPITNYGMAIAACRDVLNRVMTPFR